MSSVSLSNCAESESRQCNLDLRKKFPDKHVDIAESFSLVTLLSMSKHHNESSALSKPATNVGESSNNAVEVDNSLLRSKLVQVREENSHLIKQNHELISNLEKLSWELSKAQSRIGKLDTEMKFLHNGVDISVYKDNIKDLEARIAHMERQAAEQNDNLSIKLKQLSSDKAACENAISSHRSEIRDLKNRLEQSKQESNLLQNEVQLAGESHVEVIQLRALSNRLQEQLNQKEGARDLLEGKIHELTNLLLVEKNRSRSLENELSNSKQETLEKDMLISKEHDHVNNLTSKIATLERRCVLLSEELNSEKTLTTKLQNNADKEIAKRVSIEEKLAQQENLDNVKESYEREIRNLQTEVTSLKDKVKARKEKIMQLENTISDRHTSQQCQTDSFNETLRSKDSRIHELEKEQRMKAALEKELHKLRHSLELRENDINSASMSMKKSEKLLKDSENRILFLQRQLDQATQLAGDKRREVESVECQQEKLEQRIEELKMTNFQLEDRIHTLSTENKRLSASLTTCNDHNKALASEVETAANTNVNMLLSLEKRAHCATSRVKELEEELHKCHTELQEFQSKHADSELKWLEISGENHQLENSLKEAKAAVKNCDKDRSRFQQEILSWRRKYEGLESERNQLRDELVDLETSLASERSVRRQCEQAVQAQQIQLQKNESSLSAMEAKISQYDCEFQRLRDRSLVSETSLYNTRDNLTQCNKEIAEKNLQLKALLEENESNKAMAVSLEQKVSLLESERETIKSKYDKAEKARRDLERELKTVDTDQSNACTELVHMRHSFDNLQKEYIRVSSDNQDKENALKSSQQCLQQSKELADSLQAELKSANAELVRRCEELKRLETQFMSDHKNVADELETTKIRCIETKKKLKECSNKKSHLEKLFNERGELIIQAEEKLINLNKENEKYKLDVKQISVKAKSYFDTLSQREKDVKKLTEIIENLVKERQRLLEESACLKVQTVQCTSRGSAEKRQLAKVIEDIRSKQQTDLVELHERHLAQLAKLESENMEVKLQLKEVEQKLTNSNANCDEYKRKTEKLEDEISSLHEALNTTNERVTVKDSSLARLEVQLNSHRRSQHDLTRTEPSNEFESLKESTRNFNLFHIDQNVRDPSLRALLQEVGSNMELRESGLGDFQQD